MRLSRFQHTLFLSVNALGLILFFGATTHSASAQTPQVTHDVMPPVAGAGYDYVKSLAETVDPQMGVLDVRLLSPMPPGRDMAVPFAFEYNSNLALHYVTSVDGFPAFAWTDNASYLGRSGWRYVVPSLGVFAGTYFSGSGAGGNTPCHYFENYIFSDEAGTPRDLGMSQVDQQQACQNPPPPVPILELFTGSDGTYSATTTQMANNQSTPPAVTVTDLDGTVYQFSESLASLHTTPGDNPNNVNFRVFSADVLVSLPQSIETRNGNQITITDSGKGAITVTDELNRSVLQISGFGGTNNTNSDTVQVSGYGTLTTTWSAPLSFNWPYNSTTTLVSPTSNGSCGSAPATATGSQPVITSIALPNNQSFQFAYDSVTGLLNQITYPSGAVVSYTWMANAQSTSNNYTNTPPPNPNTITSICNLLHDTPAVKSRIVKFDGVHAALEQDFSYSTTWGPINSANGSRVWTNKQTTVITKDLVRNTSFKTIYTYTQPQAGQIANFAQTASTAVYSTAATLLRTDTKSWSYATSPPTTETVTLDNNQTSEAITCYPILTAPAPCPSVNGGFAIPTDHYDYGFGSGTPGSLLRHTHIDYQTFSANPLGAVIVDRPSDVITYDSSSNELAEVDYGYDQTALVSVLTTQHDDQNFSTGFNSGRGNVTTKTAKCFTGTGKSQKTCLQGNSVVTYAYDQTGQETSKTDANGNTTDYSFSDSFSDLGSCGSNSSSGGPVVGGPIPGGPGDPTPVGLAGSSSTTTNTNAYLTQITHPSTVNAEGTKISHIVGFCYGFSDGQLTVSTDENGQSTKFIYNDPLRRLTKTTYPDGGETDISYDDSVPSVTTTRVNSNSGNVTSTAVMDGMRHVTQTQLTSDPEGTIFSDTVYDGLGRTYTQSNPYRSTSDLTYGLTTYTYDSLGRSTQLSHPDGTSASTVYSGQDTQVSDEGNGTRPVQRISEMDALGRLTSVCEVTSATLQANNAAPSNCGQVAISGMGFLTTYQYDLLGNLTQVQQSGLQNRSFSYDSLSHLLSSANPESGAITYAYDKNGNLTSKTAPQPNQTGSATVTTTYGYDALNRLLSKIYSDGVTPSATYNYDESTAFSQSVTNPIGRMTSEVSAGAQEVSSYDPMGRVQDSYQCFPGNCNTFYDLRYVYDELGNVTSAGNGLGTTLSYAYDAANRLTGLTSSWSDANHPAALFTAASNGYGPFGLTQASFGNNNQWSEARSYDNRGRILSQTDSGIPPASSGSATLTISGSEKQVQIDPAVPGSGSLQLAGTLQPAEVASINLSQCGTGSNPCSSPIGSSSDAAHGTTSIFIVGNEQQWPAGIKPGTGSVTISPATNGVQSLGTAPGAGVLTVNGSEQSIGTAPGTGTVTINGSLQSTQVQTSGATAATGSVSVCGSDEFISTFNTYDFGTVWIRVGASGLTASASYGANQSPATLASQLVSSINGNNAFPVSAALSGSTVLLTAKSTGPSGNSIALSAGAASTATQWNGASYTCTSASGSTLSGGQNAVDTTVYDSGSCTITVNGHADSTNPSWSGSGTAAASIATSLVSAITGDSSAPVKASASGNVVTLTAKNDGTGTDYSLSSSCSYDSTHFSSPSFTPSNSGTDLTGGANKFDSGTVSVSLYPATTNFSCTSPGTALASYSVPWSQGFSSSSLGAALADAVPASGALVKTSVSGNNITLTATSNGANTNYGVCASTPTWDKTDFPNGPSFTLSAPNATSPTPGTGNLSGGTTVYDSGTVTLWVYGSSATPSCSAPSATTPNTAYAGSWGGSSASTSSVASALATAITANSGGTVSNTPAFASGSSVVNLTATTSGSVSNYPICVSSTYDATHFSQPSFTPTASGASLTGGWPTAQSTDGGTMMVTLNGTNYSATWGVNDSPGTIAANLQQSLSAATGFHVNIGPVPSSINLGITSKVYPGTNPQTYALDITPATLGTAYTFSTQTTYNTSFQPAEMQQNFLYPSFITLNSIYDYGTLQLAINGTTDTFAWSSSDSLPGTPVFYSSAVDAGGVTAAPSGSTLTMTSDAAGASTNYSWTASVANSDTTDFSSLAVSAPGSGALGGGKNAVMGPDTGTVTVNVNGYSKAIAYGGGDDSDSVAFKVINGIHDDFLSGAAPVDAADGGAGLVVLTAAASGSSSDYAFTVSSASNAGASPPSFAGSPASGALAGGGSGGGSSAQTLYSFSIATSKGSGYAPNSDVLNVTDSVNGSWTYQYDDFNRLLSATDNTNQLVYTYLYDQYGNRWQENVAQVGNTQPPTSISLLTFTGGTNQIDSTGVYLYDAAGNLLTDGFNVYAYDAEGRLACLNPNTTMIPWQCDANSINYVYNAEGERVQGPAYNYLYGEQGDKTVLNKASGTLAFGEMDANGHHLATYTPNNTAFHFADWLGTERYRVAVGSTAVETCASLPFGDGLDCRGQEWSLRHFTGKERDAESGLDYFGARYYGNTMGRFMTPDWEANATAVAYADFANPQSLNLYSYVKNNPLNATDPDGHCDIKQNDGTVEHHWGWCIWHTLGMYETHDEKVQDARNFFTNTQVTQNGRLIDPTKMTDDEVLAAFNKFNDEWQKIAIIGADPNTVLSAVQLPLFPDGGTIAAGHAWQKHQGEFPGKTESDFEKMIEETVHDARGADVKQLSNGRTAYWSDKEQMVVIHDPKSSDGGTAFRPASGKAYFNNLQ